MSDKASKTIYCGSNALPKKKRYGTVKECAELKQVRLYGIRKIDKKTLDNVLSKEAIPETRDKLIIRLTALRGTIRRAKGRYETTKDEAVKQQYHDEWKKAEKELLAVSKKLKKIEKATKKKEPKVSKKVSWLDHVQNYYNTHDVSYKEALVKAKTTYHKNKTK
jgi:hypothetical protein